MNYKQFNSYLENISTKIENQDYYIVKKQLVESFKEKFEFFNLNRKKDITLWFDNLLNHFLTLIENRKINTDDKLVKVLDITIALELKVNEINKNH